MAIPFDIESDVEKLWRIQFYSYEYTYNSSDAIQGVLSEDGDIIEDVKITWHQASFCDEVYAD